MNPVQTLAAQSTGSVHGALSGCGVAVVSPMTLLKGHCQQAGHCCLMGGVCLSPLQEHGTGTSVMLSVQSSVFQGLKSWDA